MRIHTAVVGLIRSIVVVFAIGFAWSSPVLADEPTSPPAPSDQSLQERAVPRTGVPGGLAPKTEGVIVQGNRIIALPGYVLEKGPNSQIIVRRVGGGLGVAAIEQCICKDGSGSCTISVAAGGLCYKAGEDSCNGFCLIVPYSPGVGGVIQ